MAAIWQRLINLLKHYTYLMSAIISITVSSANRSIEIQYMQIKFADSE
jgi:hypothetical protein